MKGNIQIRPNGFEINLEETNNAYYLDNGYSIMTKNVVKHNTVIRRIGNDYLPILEQVTSKAKHIRKIINGVGKLKITEQLFRFNV